MNVISHRCSATHAKKEYNFEKFSGKDDLLTYFWYFGPKNNLLKAIQPCDLKVIGIYNTVGSLCVQ
jgi:hypothetical protein